MAPLIGRLGIKVARCLTVGAVLPGNLKSRSKITRTNPLLDAV